MQLKPINFLTIILLARVSFIIASMIRRSQLQRNSKLQETKARRSYGDRAFSHVAPKLWNLLPNEISEEEDVMEFKKKLKSFLMTKGDEFIEWTKMRWPVVVDLTRGCGCVVVLMGITKWFLYWWFYLRFLLFYWRFKSVGIKFLCTAAQVSFTQLKSLR